jgi:transposase-like protein
MNIRSVNIKFATDEQCLEYIQQMRWPDGVVRCPVCGNDKIQKVERQSKSKNKRAWFYLCLEKTCHHQFTPTSGTIFHDTHLPLIVWFHAIALVLNAKKGISAAQLQRDLGIGGYKTAWYLVHRIREAMQEGDLPKLGGTVEIDETYIGARHQGHQHKPGHPDCKKQIVVGIRQRGGPLRFFHAEDVKSGTLAKYIQENVSEDVDVIVTDEFNSYPTALKSVNMGDRHKTIKHKSKIYVQGEVHTNTIESAFSLLKRGIIGNFHRISIKHLWRYLNEFQYRFNRREDTDGAFIETVARIAGFKPLPFTALTSEKA